MMRVVLADDEPLALRRLLRALEAVAGITVVGVASDGDAALQRIIELVPDLAILDIEMPGRLTAFDRYAADAFSVEAVDYLLKPVRAERLVQALARASRRRAERLTGRDPGMLPSTADLDGHTLHLPNRDGGRDLPQAQIVWIEAAKDYALIYTFTRSHILRVTMAELAQQLHPSILRVHRSAFVAAAVVQRRVRIERGLFSLLLLDGTRVQVGPSYAQSVKAHLKALRPELD
jgi:DNA-binding LytR/AlgR family response regulator